MNRDEKNYLSWVFAGTATLMGGPHLLPGADPMMGQTFALAAAIAALIVPFWVVADNRRRLGIGKPSPLTLDF